MATQFPEGRPLRSFSVSGRQGILIRQKLSFGPYTTSGVKRSWTTGYEFDWARTLRSPSTEALSIRDVDRKQRLRFN